MKTLLKLCVAVAGLTVAAMPALATEPLKVVELFTSQGCNSCPPADAYLGEIADDQDVLALSFHVDYWNYLGWRDEFSDAIYTRRQRDYSARMRSRYVYTPQMVINGANHHPGNSRGIVASALAVAEPVELSPTMVRTGEMSAQVTLPETEKMPLAIWVVGFDHRHDVQIGAGENGGRTISYHHVVRELQYLGSWDGKSRVIDIALDKDCDGGMAILLQRPDGGPLVGASMIRF
jgi:hypothetical protein